MTGEWNRMRTLLLSRMRERFTTTVCGKHLARLVSPVIVLVVLQGGCWWCVPCIWKCHTAPNMFDIFKYTVTQQVDTRKSKRHVKVGTMYHTRSVLLIEVRCTISLIVSVNHHQSIALRKPNRFLPKTCTSATTRLIFWLIFYDQNEILLVINTWQRHKSIKIIPPPPFNNKFTCIAQVSKHNCDCDK